MGQSSSIHIAGIAVILCLLIAGSISILTGPQQQPDTNIHASETSKSSVTSVPDNSGKENTYSGRDQANRLRILWYDYVSRTYTFRDHPLSKAIDPKLWTVDKLPAPENGTVQRKAALVRFLNWNGIMERMIDTTYLIDQETITGILNSFTLIAPPPPIQPTPSVTQTTTTEPTPFITPAPGMLIPTRGVPCNQGDNTITISFGYINRHNTQVFVPIGDKNRFLPEKPDRGQPTVFNPGINSDVFTVSFPADGTTIIWNLMDTYVSAEYVPPLSAGLLVDPLTGYAPLTVGFQDKSSGGTTENARIGFWDLGDGTRSEEEALSHRYEKPGTYKVSRTVHTLCGIERKTENVTVLKADFTMEQVPEIPRTYRFSDHSEGDPAAWIWDFSDDTTSLDQNPMHTWKASGTYPVGLRVASKNGSGTVVKRVTV